MGRVSRGFSLVGISWRVLGTDPQLLVLPLLSLLVIGACAGLTYLLSQALDIGIPLSTRHATTGQWLLLAAFYASSSLGTIFFNAALVGAASIRLQGGTPSVSEGLRMAAARLHVILLWALISATVGLVVRALQSRVPYAVKLVTMVLGAAWGVATYFVVPVLVLERRGVAHAVRRSTRLVAQRWGEQFAGSGLIMGALLLLLLPFIAVCAAFLVVSVPLGVTLMVLGGLVLLVMGGALSAVFDAALYRYATTGEVAQGWTEDHFQAAFWKRHRFF